MPEKDSSRNSSRSSDTKMPVKSDGTKDKRFKTAQVVKADGTRDMRTKLKKKTDI